MQLYLHSVWCLVKHRDNFTLPNLTYIHTKGPITLPNYKLVLGLLNCITRRAYIKVTKDKLLYMSQDQRLEPFKLIYCSLTRYCARITLLEYLVKL